ncbi:MAG: tRNA threonylcarbamoyladenosine dehydratase [Limnochordia bacterium]|jgi:tRNA A37 threonylcarbamoyladenosine dehydratase|nr:tRNA threonylcarbamoyladenosine dehydratase [Limnochordia bacterium]MDI9465117.1 tRNA threonylcarbamoyladenosine dehydratase [Bacillota bacterium]NLO95811.1 tRNA threonylcarbamoyladenosine dehydratase [Bacillota bacterium]HAN95227.1 tRNA threonylcarbamoyladenosine dehydratase [Bacillota bacterium]HOB40885.1 tRNA threonylcarbamoyladenosine dehydratase [Limnochordia bacterium]
MEHRFIRTELVLGAENLQRLQAAKVAVVGLGGVGGHAAEALARSGVGTLILIDHDLVAISNLNRQIVALEATIGRPKVEVMAERIAQINPACRVIAHQAYYSRENHQQLLPEDLTFVADAIDSVRSKVDLIEACLKQGIPLISSLGAGNKVDPTRLKVADISQTHTCPLARAVRGALRKRGIERGVAVVFSDERTVGKRAGSTPGSTAFVPGAAGLVMASWIVRQICGEG